MRSLQLSTVALLAAAVTSTSAHAASPRVVGPAADPASPPAALADAAPAPEVRQLNLGRRAISPNGDGSGDRLVVSFSLPPGSPIASVRVVDASGAPVRMLGQFAPVEDRIQVTWRGIDDSGRLVRDGRYRVVLEPALPDAAVAMDAAPSAPSEAATISEVVRVDRRAPRLRLLRHDVPVASRASRSVMVPLVASERATMRMATSGVIGTSRRLTHRGPGRFAVRIPVRRRAALSRALDARGRATVSMRIAVRDDAGNDATRRMAFDVLPPASERLTWPLQAAVTSGFGPRWGRLHAGIDMPVPEGTAIRAAGPGRVKEAGWSGGYGNTLVIDHGPYDTLYAHNSRLLVRVGQRVARGQLVAHSGNTGSSTGAHLHFEVHVGGSPRDPLAYLP